MRMRKPLPTMPANHWIKRACVANIVILALLSPEVWSYANMKRHRLVRQVNTDATVNYEGAARTSSHHQPHFTANRTVVVQLFEWKFVDVAAECRDFLGPQGYAGVQLSPVLEHTVIKTTELNHPWWERYEVVSYRLASRSGNEAEFWSMSRICNEQGVRIYADVVLNHMAAPLHFVGVTKTDTDNFMVNTSLATNVNVSQLNYSNVSYTQLDFHRPPCVLLANAQDAHEIRNCQLNGHPDLDHSRHNVQKHIVDMLNKFVDMGVAGFRIDAAKYIWPIDLKNIFKQVRNLSTEFSFPESSRPFFYSDVFDLGLDTVSKTEYTTYGVVSEYLYATELAIILNRKAPLSSLINWGPALGFLPSEDALVFVDSHDTQRGFPADLRHNHMLMYKNRVKYVVGNVFMLVHPYGAIKRIMSSYYFPLNDTDQGPPAEEPHGDEIRSPKFDGQKQCTKESGWVCEHRWPQVVNMLKVANYFKAPSNKEDSVIYFQTNGPHQVAFCRGRKAFVAINNDPEADFVKQVYACLEPGTYCDVVTGGKVPGKEECHGKIFEIDEKGYMALELVAADRIGVDSELAEEDNNEEGDEFDEIQSYGIIVIYVESKIGGEAETRPAEEQKEGEKPSEASGNSAENNAEEMNDEGASENANAADAIDESNGEDGITNEVIEDDKVDHNEEQAVETHLEKNEEGEESFELEAQHNLANTGDKEEGNPEGTSVETNDASSTGLDDKEEQEPFDRAVEENKEKMAEALNESAVAAQNDSTEGGDNEIVQTEDQENKPSADMVDEVHSDSNAVTARVQDIEAAGFLAKPKATGTNG